MSYAYWFLDTSIREPQTSSDPSPGRVELVAILLRLVGTFETKRPVSKRLDRRYVRRRALVTARVLTRHCSPFGRNRDGRVLCRDICRVGRLRCLYRVDIIVRYGPLVSRGTRSRYRPLLSWRRRGIAYLHSKSLILLVGLFSLSTQAVESLALVRIGKGQRSQPRKSSVAQANACNSFCRTTAVISSWRSFSNMPITRLSGP